MGGLQTAPTAYILGSSGVSGGGGSGSEKEVVMITKAVGHALDDLNLVVDAFEQTGM